MSEFVVIIPKGREALDYDQMVHEDKTIVEMGFIDDSQIWVRLG